MRKIATIMVSVPLTLVGGTVFAQSDVGAETLEEIVVTAEKRETNLQKTPASIQVTKGEDLRKEGKRRLDEIMDGVVGVQAQGSEVGTSFYMRGVGFDRGQMGAPGGSGPTQQAVAVVVDGVYQSRMEAVRGGTLDVGQAEVMRGPQSTTLGGSSLAGAVSLVSNKPVFEYQGRGLVEVGNYDKLSTEGVVNVPLADNQAIRFAVSTDKRDSYLSSGIGNSDLLNARLKYRWQPSDALDIVLTIGKQKIDGTGVTLGALSYQGFYTPYQQCTQSGLISGIYNCSDTSGAGAGVLTRGYPPTYGHVDNGVTYKDRSNPWDDGMPANRWGHDVFARTSITSYSANIDWDLGFATLSIVPSVDTGTFESAEAGGPGAYVSEHNRFDTRQLDAHLNSGASSPFQWLVGVNYYDYDQPGAFEFTVYPGQSGPGGPCASLTDIERDSNGAPVLDANGEPIFLNANGTNCSNWLGNNETSQKTEAIYGNVTVPIIDTLRLIGGLRYTKDTKAAQGSVPDVVAGTAGGPATPFAWGTRYEGDWSKTTYRAGIEYDVTPSSMAYAVYSTGYQPGNLSVGMDGSLTVGQAQTLSQITVGIKNRFFNDTLQLNLEAFDSKYHNRGQQASIQIGALQNCVAPPGPPASLIVDANYTCLVKPNGNLVVPNLTSQGADVELNWLPTSADRFDLSLEYLKAEQTAPVATNPVTAAVIVATAGAPDPGGNTVANLLAAYNAQVASYEGATLQSSPKWSGNFTYQHDFNLAGGSRLTPRVNVAYKSSYWTAGQGLSGTLTPQNPGPAQQDAYALYNAYLVWDKADGRFSATAYVKNIDNKPVLLDYSGASSFRGAAAVSLGDPRTFGLILTANF